MEEIFAWFGSRSLTEHLVRGALAFGAIVLAIRYEYLVWPLFIFLPAALLLWRGCPACWAMGFYETIRRKFDPNPGPLQNWTGMACRIVRSKLTRPPTSGS